MKNLTEPSAKCDFFVTYHHRDEPWAEWIAWQLEEAGYTVRSHPWNFAARYNFQAEMLRASGRAERIIAVLSANYLKADISAADWDAAFEQDPRGEKGRLISIRTQPRKLQGILAELNFIDFADCTATECREHLLAGIQADQFPAPQPTDPAKAVEDALARWQERRVFLETQVDRITNLELKVILSQTVDAAIDRINSLRDAALSGQSAVSTLDSVKPTFPPDESDFEDHDPDLHGKAFLLRDVGAGRLSETFDRYSLLREETTMGRHPICDIFINVKTVSRLHATIIRRGESYTIKDAGSQNGTRLNGKRLTKPQTLNNGDRIHLGKVEFAFHHGGSSGSVSSDEGLKLLASPEDKLGALVQISSKLSKTLSLDEILPIVLDSLFTILPTADRGFVVMKNTNGELVPRWLKCRQKSMPAESVRISRAIIRQVMESGEAIISADAADDSRFDSDSVQDSLTRSMICAPLRDSEGDVFGALQIDSTQGRGEFNHQDLHLLKGVASQAGIVINIARMHDQTQMQRQVEHDLKLAAGVRQAFLPTAPPQVNGFRFSSFYQGAPYVAGDYYDYITLPDGRTAIVFADIVGHGIAAAMFMAKLSADTKDCLEHHLDPVDAVDSLNDRLNALHTNRFVTLLLLALDQNSSKVTVVNAGHMPPIVRRNENGSLHDIGGEESGMPIAIEQGIHYQAVEFEMNEGDVAVVFSDGVTDAMNSQDEDFGIKRLRTNIAHGGDADQIKDRIANSVLEHVGEAPAYDDICLLVIERTGNAST